MKAAGLNHSIVRVVPFTVNGRCSFFTHTQMSQTEPTYFPLRKKKPRGGEITVVQNVQNGDIWKLESIWTDLKMIYCVHEGFSVDYFFLRLITMSHFLCLIVVPLYGCIYHKVQYKQN